MLWFKVAVIKVGWSMITFIRLRKDMFPNMSIMSIKQCSMKWLCIIECRYSSCSMQYEYINIYLSLNLFIPENSNKEILLWILRRKQIQKSLQLTFPFVWGLSCFINFHYNRFKCKSLCTRKSWCICKYAVCLFLVKFTNIKKASL